MITKSAQKANRQNIRRRAVNSERKKNLKEILKIYKKLVVAKKIDEAQKALPAVFKALDKMAKVGVIKPNKASRLKSRLSKLIAIKK